MASCCRSAALGWFLFAVARSRAGGQGSLRARSRTDTLLWMMHLWGNISLASFSAPPDGTHRNAKNPTPAANRSCEMQRAIRPSPWRLCPKWWWIWTRVPLKCRNRFFALWDSSGVKSFQYHTVFSFAFQRQHGQLFKVEPYNDILTSYENHCWYQNGTNI